MGGKRFRLGIERSAFREDLVWPYTAARLGRSPDGRVRIIRHMLPFAVATCLTHIRAHMNWEILASRYILKTPWMDVREDRVLMPDGEVLDPYHVIESPDWVCVICIDEHDRLVIVEQYRHGIQQVCYELPAGAIDGSEPPEVAGRRELLEETGFEARGWSSIGWCVPEPGKHTNRAHLFVATGGRRVDAQTLDRSEDIRVHLMTSDDVFQLIDNGRFPHGIHQVALLRARLLGLL